MAIMASAVVVLGGLGAVARIIWHAAQDVRDNKSATVANTKALDEVSRQMTYRFDRIEARVSRLENGRTADGAIRRRSYPY